MVTNRSANIPQFSKLRAKMIEGYNTLHLGRKYARGIICPWTHSFPRATLSENCSLLGTDNVRGQIS